MDYQFDRLLIKLDTSQKSYITRDRIAKLFASFTLLAFWLLNQALNYCDMIPTAKNLRLPCYLG